MNPLCAKMIRELAARRKAKRKLAENDFLAYKIDAAEKCRKRRHEKK